MADDDFLYRDLPVVNKRVHRLGLAFNWIDEDGIRAGLEQGQNYLFWQKFRKGHQHELVKEAVTRDRERYVLASGAFLGYSAGRVRRNLEKLLRSFDVDYLDVFQLFWLSKLSALTESVQAELVKLKEEGLVRAIGVSIHDRPRAGRLAVESPLDLLMIRYNAAHPGAETDIFPAYQKRRPLTVAYTATSWRKLLKRPRGWKGPVMTAGDCYRFCLSSPHVDVTLCGPRNRAMLEANLAAIQKGPLSPEEDRWMREFGRAVHG